MAAPVVVRFVGKSGSGKTTLIAGVVKILVKRGHRVGVIKHSSGFADPDRPGKDSYKFKRAGAAKVLLASKARSVLFHEHSRREPSVKERLKYFEGYPLVLLESWKGAKLKGYRTEEVVVERGVRLNPQRVAAALEKKYLSGVRARDG